MRASEDLSDRLLRFGEGDPAAAEELARRALRLALPYVHDLPNVEIAVALGCRQPASAAARLHRAAPLARN